MFRVQKPLVIVLTMLVASTAHLLLVRTIHTVASPIHGRKLAKPQQASCCLVLQAIDQHPELLLGKGCAVSLLKCPRL